MRSQLHSCSLRVCKVVKELDRERHHGQGNWQYEALGSLVVKPYSSYTPKKFAEKIFPKSKHCFHLLAGYGSQCSKRKKRKAYFHKCLSSPDSIYLLHTAKSPRLLHLWSLGARYDLDFCLWRSLPSTVSWHYKSALQSLHSFLALQINITILTFHRPIKWFGPKPVLQCVSSAHHQSWSTPQSCCCHNGVDIIWSFLSSWSPSSVILADKLLEADAWLKLDRWLWFFTAHCSLECARRFQRPEEMSRGKGLGAQAGNEDVETWEKGAWRSAQCPFFFLQLS